MDTRRSKLRSGRRRWSQLPPRAPRCWPQTAPAAPRPGRRPAPPLRPAPTCAERAQTLLVKSLPACRGGGAKRRRGGSGALFPRGEIAALFVGQPVLLYQRPHLPDPGRQLIESLEVDLGVEVTRVGEDRAVLHRLEMLAVQHVDVAGDGDENVALARRVVHLQDAKPIHGRLE